MSDSNFWIRNRVSRRSAIRGAALGGVGLAGAALIGCGGDDAPATSAPTAAPTAANGGGGDPTATMDPTFANAVYGGHLNVDFGDEPVTLDNHIEETPGSVFAANQAYDHLFHRSEDYVAEPGVINVTPQLAAEWEQQDEQTLVLNLQRGVKWHNLPPVNGRDFTAEDVVYSIDRMRGNDPRLRTAPALSAISTVEATDDNTVVIKTAAPYASLVANLGHTWSVIVPPELGETAEIEQRSVGTGPFIFQEWRRGVELNWVKNPDYWRNGHPFVDSMTQRIIPDAATRLANFRTGDTLSWSGGYSATPKEQVDAVVASSQGATIQEYFASGGVVKIAFDTANEPFQDERLRNAIKYAIDYDRVIALFGGLASRTRGPFSAINGEWAPDEDILANHDPAEATRLFAAAGVSPETPLNTKTQVSQFYSGPTVSQVTQSLLRPFGVEVEIEIMENARWVTEVYRGGAPFQMSSHGDWAWEDPDRGLYSYYHSTGTANSFHYSNPDTDRLLDLQRTQFDVEERRQTVRDIVINLIEDSPQVWIVSTGGVSIQAAKFQNFKLMLGGNSNSYRQYADVWIDG